MSQTLHLKENSPAHLDGNDSESRSRAFRNGSLHSQDAIGGQRGHRHGGVGLHRQPEHDRKMVATAPFSGQTDPLLAQTAALPAYLYFRVKHLAANPCSPGLSSCFPGDRLQFTRM